MQETFHRELHLSWALKEENDRGRMESGSESGKIFPYSGSFMASSSL